MAAVTGRPTGWPKFVLFVLSTDLAGADRLVDDEEASKRIAHKSERSECRPSPHGAISSGIILNWSFRSLLS